MYPKCMTGERELVSALEKAEPGDLEQAISKHRPGFGDFIKFLSPAASGFLSEMRGAAEARKKMYFGKTARFYSPLYLSNACVNRCVYCNFRADHSVRRKTLSLEEVIAEAEVLRGYGIDSVLLVSGEDPEQVTVDFLEDVVHGLKQMFSYLAIEIYPLDVSGYRRLFEAGVDGLTLYQETYERELYAKFHPSGPKKDYDKRLEAVNKGGLAGMRVLGIGCLLGLYDWRVESVSLAAHAAWLRKHFWKSRVQFSFPRITGTEGAFSAPAPLSEAELEQMMLAFRLFFPDAPIAVSTRESPAFRNRIIKSCASHVSAASRVVPGAYSDGESVDLGQFTLNDRRGVADIRRELENQGIESVFKDWDRCIAR